jgi:hypothetical protein
VTKRLFTKQGKQKAQRMVTVVMVGSVGLSLMAGWLTYRLAYFLPRRLLGAMAGGFVVLAVLTVIRGLFER